MKRWLLAGLLALVAGQAAAFDPVTASRYASPDMFRPNVDAIIARGTGDAVQSAGNVVCTSGNCLLAGFAGFNLKGSLGTTTFARPAINLPDGLLLYSATSDFSTPKGLEIKGSTILLEPTDAVRILTPVSSLARALDVVQSGPASGTTAGPVTLNRFDLTWRSAITGDGSYGLAGSASVSGMQVSLNVGGANFDAHSAFGGAFGINHTLATASGSDMVGLSGGLFTDAFTNGHLYGGSSGVTAGPNAVAPSIIGHEVDLDIKPGANIPVRIGFNAANQGTRTASVLDSAFAAMTLGFPGTTTGRWKKLISLTNNGGQLPPALSDDADFFYSDHEAFVANFANLPNLTVTGLIFNFKNFTVTGTGQITADSANLYGAAPSVIAGHVGLGGGTTATADVCGKITGSTGCWAINVGGTVRYVPFF